MSGFKNILQLHIVLILINIPLFAAQKALDRTSELNGTIFHVSSPGSGATPAGTTRQLNHKRIRSKDQPYCNLHIGAMRQDGNKTTLILTHDANCTLVTNQDGDNITITPELSADNRAEASGNAENIRERDTVEELISLAKSKLGNSYMPAQAGPDHFDCSGFVYYLFRKNGITIPRSSLEQSRIGKKLDRSEIKRGDILFFDTYERKHINHSGIYLGNGKFIHSSSGKAYGVTISDLDKGFYKDKFRWGIRKIGESTLPRE